jgi:hypothetical protein
VITGSELESDCPEQMAAESSNAVTAKQLREFAFIAVVLSQVITRFL